MLGPMPDPPASPCCVHDYRPHTVPVRSPRILSRVQLSAMHRRSLASLTMANSNRLAGWIREMGQLRLAIGCAA